MQDELRTGEGGEGKKKRFKGWKWPEGNQKVDLPVGDTSENEKDTFNNHNKLGLSWAKQDIWSL